MQKSSKPKARAGARRLVAAAVIWSLAPAVPAQADPAEAEAEAQAQAQAEAQAQADAPTVDPESAALRVYRRGQAVPQDELVDLGPPADLGGEVLEGDPRISARIDLSDGTFTAGVFQATRGKVLIHFPFTEHATILSGSVELTDATGAHATLHPGDSYLITQGSDIVWEVEGARVQKSFANRVEAQDAPGPMRIYEARAEVEGDELVALGSPEALGGVVLAGDPQVAARFDLPDASAGVMQTTAGALSIDFAFAAHATVAAGRLRLTDEDGCTHALRPGDAYLVRPGATVEWDVAHHPVQQSFFHAVP